VTLDLRMARGVVVRGLIATLMAACTASPPADTPVARLRVDVEAMKAFPSALISRPCADALKELTSTVNAATALQQSGKPVDPVTEDVMQSDQSVAETACHPDAVRVCQSPATPEATRACRSVVGMAPYPSRLGE
jgi:hypothetical protein